MNECGTRLRDIKENRSCSNWVWLNFFWEKAPLYSELCALASPPAARLTLTYFAPLFKCKQKLIGKFSLMYNLTILLPAASLTLSRLFWVPYSVWINGHCLTGCLCGLFQYRDSEHVSVDPSLHYINWIKDVHLHFVTETLNCVSPQSSAGLSAQCGSFLKEVEGGKEQFHQLSINYYHWVFHTSPWIKFNQGHWCQQVQLLNSYVRDKRGVVCYDTSQNTHIFSFSPDVMQHSMCILKVLNIILFVVFSTFCLTIQQYICLLRIRSLKG